MAASNYVESQTLSLWLKNQTVQPPSTLWAALYINNPSDSDSGTEVTGGGYQRTQIQFGNVTQQGNSATVLNTNRVEFPEATAQWGKVAYIGIRDQQSGGNLLFYSPLRTALDVVIGTQPRFDVGTVTVTLD